LSLLPLSITTIIHSTFFFVLTSNFLNLQIENQTDSMDAHDYMKVLKETAKLKAREMALQARDTAFENGVSKLKQVENHQLNMTHDEKEELAEEVQDDMMKLDGKYLYSERERASRNGKHCGYRHSDFY